MSGPNDFRFELPKLRVMVVNVEARNPDLGDPAGSPSYRFAYFITITNRSEDDQASRWEAANGWSRLSRGERQVLEGNGTVVGGRSARASNRSAFFQYNSRHFAGHGRRGWPRRGLFRAGPIQPKVS